jgi:hypothetical protein
MAKHPVLKWIDVRAWTWLSWLGMRFKDRIVWTQWRNFQFPKTGIEFLGQFNNYHLLKKALYNGINYEWICMNGAISFVINLSFSLERSIKFQQVHQIHDELDLGLKKWQDQILTLQWKATQQAEAKATRHLDSKRQKVENENRARWLHHTHLMDRSVNHNVNHHIVWKSLGTVLNYRQFLHVLCIKCIKLMHKREVMPARPSICHSLQNDWMNFD